MLPSSAMRRLAAVLLLASLAVSLACAGSGARLSSSPAPAVSGTPRIAGVSAADLQVRALLLYLVDRQDYEPVVVQQALSGGPALREALAEALGRIPDRQGRSPLIGLLLDEEPAVRRAAAFALGELDDPEAVPALLQAVTDEDRETGTLAVEALGKLKAPVLDVAQALLPLPEQERWVRLFPHLFLFKESASVLLAERGLKLPDPEIRARAAYALARDPLPGAAEPLRGLLGDSDPRIRGWAARALGQVGGGEDLARLLPLLAAAELPPVIQALRAGRQLVVEGKVITPSALAAREAWRAPLLALLSDPRSGVRSTAIDAAAVWLPDADLAAALAERVEKGSGRERGLALVALATGKAPRAAELIALAIGPRPAETPGVGAESGALEDLETSDLRAHAAEAAGKLGAVGALDLLAQDQSPAVRGAVAAARLARLAPDDTAGGEKLAAAILADPDGGVRLAALDWLGEHPVLPMAALGPAVAKALVDESEEPGLAGLRALGARAKAVVADRPAALEMAGYVVEKEGYVLRRAAIALFKELEAPAPELLPPDDSRRTDDYREILERTWGGHRIAIETEKGMITVDLTCRAAPLTCLSFLQLAAQGFFDGLTFHRVVPDFVIQGGDPRGDGVGGPGYSIRDEIGRLRYERGVLGMALAGPDTGGSQFFLTLSPQPHLDGGFTAFGKVVAGDAVLDLIQGGDRIVRIAEVPSGPQR